MLEQKVTELIEKIEQAVPEIGGKAIEYGLWDTFYAGVQNLVIGLATLLIATWAARNFCKALARNYECDEFQLIVNGLLAISAAGTALFNLLNIWNWVAVFDTERALAHRIIEKLL